ncbi:calcium ATPase [Aspergillus sclerotioniger CBS 115572]|uniref:Calcium ATPase n=1 Tax=Aspergillus sclerotioniger CBS 115572 TaxID=1450535 RepID=A0A317VN55_9EURO|nr:calcium ATPase [Aspergillus sclerotioniger CBS 115572]PWY74517.1 calcium ATPase [Aspergillus sclerotioniger CBS 115572]
MSPTTDIKRDASSSSTRRPSTNSHNDSTMDEYTRLVHFTSTYREKDANSPNPARSARSVSGTARGKTSVAMDACRLFPSDWRLTGIHHGLSESDLTLEKENPVASLLSCRFFMEFAIHLAAGSKDWIGIGVITGILCLNAAVGWYQETQAEDVVASLKAGIAMRSTVVRVRELVPGDAVRQTVPAVAKYQNLQDEGKLDDKSDEKSNDEGSSDDDDDDDKGYPILACDHSAITGESLAVHRFVGDQVFYTTGCKRGNVLAAVQATGKRAFVGCTALMVQNAKDTGHFQMVMDSIGTVLLVIVMAWLLAVWIGGFFQNTLIALPGKQTLLFYTLSILIVGVPVGLPVVTTTTLAVGAAYLANKKAIVQKLTAIELLAGVDILCSDKTGTLTANRLSICEPFVAEGVDVNWMFAVAALASSHNVRFPDPIDKVTVLSILQQGWKTENFTLFDTVLKWIVANEGEYWNLLGMLSMFDPLRDDTAQTIAEAQKLGIKVKMLTGDAIAVAKETCKMLALGITVYNSEKLISGGLSGAMAGELVEKADGFAEVFPEHKYQADCGIAVEGASEAAQSVSDIVFLEPGLYTIIDIIEVARQIFHRMKAYIQYRIALCLYLEIYLVTTMIILNESICTDLVVFLALFADVASVAVAYDHTFHELRPNWLIFVMRGSSTWPSLPLVAAIFGVDVLATIFCLFGWFSNRDMITDLYDQYISKEMSNGWTDIVTVVRLWGYCIGVEIVIALVYYGNGIGDEAVRRVLGHLANLSLEFESNGEGNGTVWLASRGKGEDDEVVE